VIEPNGRGVLDTPHSRGMTALGGADSATSLRGAIATKQSSSLGCGAAYGLLRGACHRAALCADPLARNDVLLLAV
jgi:hypothetical protein